MRPSIYNCRLCCVCSQSVKLIEIRWKSLNVPNQTNSTLTKKMPCGYCRESGHNVRTCMPFSLGDETPTEVDYEAEDFTQVDLQSFFDAEVSAEQRSNDECIICYEVISSGNVKLECGHKYCLNCFSQHIRIRSDCAYCRQEVCTVPPPSSKRNEMSADTRREMLEHYMLHSDDLVEMFKGDFIRQMRASIIDQQQDVQNHATAKMIEMCTLAVQEVDLSFAMWSAGVRMSDYMSDWYESR